jgi:hypothetical protein
MFSKHVTKDLSAYCNGELSVAASREVAEHLIACGGCRSEFDEVKLGTKLAECLPEVPAPDSLWHKLQNLIDTQPSTEFASKDSRYFSFKIWRPRFVAVAASIVLAALVAALWFYSRESRPFWEVASLNGAPKVGSSRIDAKGRLALGQWLETDNNSRAQINVGSIGQVEIDPNTRVRLVETKPTEHRLELERGKMSARIWAPPRLFFVDTPSGVAADLGCAYTLEVDDEGRSLLHVTAGWVALQLKDRESMVPAGATCETRPGVGPGTPYFDDASTMFREAISQIDFEPAYQSKIPPLYVALTEARPRDTLTLWHLLARLEGNDRLQVYKRLAELGPPPDGVTREGVLQLNQEMLDLWKNKLELTWSNQSAARKVFTRIWTTALGKVNGFQGKK